MKWDRLGILMRGSIRAIRNTDLESLSGSVAISIQGIMRKTRDRDMEK